MIARFWNLNIISITLSRQVNPLSKYFAKEEPTPDGALLKILKCFKVFQTSLKFEPLKGIFGFSFLDLKVLHSSRLPFQDIIDSNGFVF